MIEVWTDGAFSRGKPPKHPPVGGWAWCTEDGRQDSGGEEHTTSQRMEMRAALQAALTVLDDEIRIVSDSAYVVNCFQEQWYLGWELNGWMTSTRKPVANRDLWELLIDIVEFRGITFRKVRGHVGDVMNERADKLAVAAKKELFNGRL